MAGCSGLLPFEVYPPDTVFCKGKVLPGQATHIAERDTGETRKQEHVADKIQVRSGKLCFHQFLQFCGCQRFGNNGRCYVLVAGKRVIAEKPVIDGYLYDSA